MPMQFEGHLRVLEGTFGAVTEAGSAGAQLTGNFAGAPEDTSIGDRRLVRLLAGN